MDGDPHFVHADDQHYIPKFYLKGFTDSKKTLYVYEKGKAFRASKPKHEAHRPDYYTHAEKGTRDTTAEDSLKVVESRVASIVRRLATSQFEPTQEQWGELYFFIALMFARTPSWREHLDRTAAETARQIHLKIATDKEKFYQSCRSCEAAMGKSLGDWETLRQLILSEKYEIRQASIAYNLGAMFESAFTVLNELVYFGCYRYYAPPGTFFFTSDSPVITLQPDSDGYATIGIGWSLATEAVFPVNKRLCLRFKRGKADMSAAELPATRVASLNRLIMATASSNLYGPDGTRRNARLFEQYGCRVRIGESAFLTASQATEYQRRLGNKPRIL